MWPVGSAVIQAPAFGLISTSLFLQSSCLDGYAGLFAGLLVATYLTLEAPFVGHEHECHQNATGSLAKAQPLPRPAPSDAAIARSPVPPSHYRAGVTAVTVLRTCGAMELACNFVDLKERYFGKECNAHTFASTALQGRANNH